MRYNKATEKEIISLREAHGIGERLGEQLCETDGRIYSLDQFPVSDELANQITPDFLPASWAKLWNSKSAKHRLWRMIEASIIEKLKNNPPLATVVLDLHNGERVQFGSREPLPLSELRYGEGDLVRDKCCTWQQSSPSAGGGRLSAPLKTSHLRIRFFFWQTYVKSSQDSTLHTNTKNSPPFSAWCGYFPHAKLNHLAAR